MNTEDLSYTHSFLEIAVVSSYAQQRVLSDRCENVAVLQSYFCLQTKPETDRLMEEWFEVRWGEYSHVIWTL